LIMLVGDQDGLAGGGAAEREQRGVAVLSRPWPRPARRPGPRRRRSSSPGWAPSGPGRRGSRRRNRGRRGRTRWRAYRKLVLLPPTVTTCAQHHSGRGPGRRGWSGCGPAGSGRGGPGHGRVTCRRLTCSPCAARSAMSQGDGGCRRGRRRVPAAVISAGDRPDTESGRSGAGLCGR